MNCQPMRNRDSRCVRKPSVFAAGFFLALCSAGTVFAGDSSVLPEGKIGYVLTHKYWAVYQTPEGETECPNGFNLGPREQFALLFPNDGTKRTLLETQLARESEVYHPGTSEEPFPFHEAVGNTAPGLNLDGRIDSNDFVSPDGDQGIDNQLYRALGCVVGYRGPDGAFYHFSNVWLQRYGVNRLLIEITDIDNLTNDDEVTVTTYRGLDNLLTDASGKGFISGGTQRVDARWGKRFIREFKGKIVDGVLTTNALDIGIPWSEPFNTHTIQWMKDVRFSLKLSPESAEGILGGYVDIDDWNRRLVRSLSTHHSSYGQGSAPSLYRALVKVADAYPDPQTGENTAVSAAVELKFVQTHILHPEPRNGSQNIAKGEAVEMQAGLSQ